MSRRFAGSEGRRRPLLALWVAFNTAVISLLMSALGATPALAAPPTVGATQDIRENVWLPLACNVSLGGGTTAPAHIGVVLNVTHKDHVDQNQSVDLSNTTAVQVLPRFAQQVAASTYAPDSFSGIVTDFENTLSGATSSFVNSGTPTQVNLVNALQPTNYDAPNPVDPLVDPTTANPAPGGPPYPGGSATGGDWWTNTATPIPASDSRRHNVFSFGPIPTPGGIDPTYTFNAYGPSPGTGGGTLPTSGTPDTLHIYPGKATGAPGTNVVLTPGKPGTTITIFGSTTVETFAAHASVFFHQTNDPLHAGPDYIWTAPLPVDCGLDTFAVGTTGANNSVPVPNPPGFCTSRPSVVNPRGIPQDCFTTDSNNETPPASAQPGIAIPITAAATETETQCGITNTQYTLTGSDGSTWQELDQANLRVVESPAANQSTVLKANADLFTNTAGYNQDIGIFVSDNGGADTLLAWKESGGFAGTYSPNAAEVQIQYSMTAGHTYVFKLKWKTNKPAGGVTIYAAAGSPGNFSPTTLTSEVFPSPPNFAVSTTQYTLTSSDGSTWQNVDPGAGLTTTLAPAANATAVLGANVDLFTNTAGYNQDIGIFVSDNGGADALVAWKESGGFAGIYSPNAAFIQSSYAMTGGHSYAFKLKWKTNNSAVGVTPPVIIYAAAGSPGNFSQTSLLAETTHSGASLHTAGSTTQYTLLSSTGSAWQTIDAALNQSVTGSNNTYALLGANADLFTDTAGYNQDIGIFVSDNGGADQQLAWKESGGFAGIYSPNAAEVQTALPLASGHTYVFKLKWKTNKPAGGVTIYAAAGSPGNFSPTRLTAVVDS